MDAEMEQYTKSTNIIYCIKKLKEKNHTIMSLDAGKKNL